MLMINRRFNTFAQQSEASAKIIHDIRALLTLTSLDQASVDKINQCIDRHYDLKTPVTEQVAQFQLETQHWSGWVASLVPKTRLYQQRRSVSMSLSQANASYNAIRRVRSQLSKRLVRQLIVEQKKKAKTTPPKKKTQPTFTSLRNTANAKIAYGRLFQRRRHQEIVRVAIQQAACGHAPSLHG